MSEKLQAIFQQESTKFQEYYLWLKREMPARFFEIGDSNTLLVAHSLMELDFQEYVSSIQLKNSAIVLCLDKPNADLEILKHYPAHGIVSYQTYVSQSPPPFPNVTLNLRIAILNFSVDKPVKDESYSEKEKKKLRNYLAKHHPEITDADFDVAINNITSNFLLSLPEKDLAIAIKMYHRATTRDHCQYEVIYDEDWELKGTASMQIILAWRNTPKHNFLYRLARTIFRHDLTTRLIYSSHRNLYSVNSILVMKLDIHGANGQSVWEATNLLEFIRDFLAVKYFASFDAIDLYLVQKGIISSSQGNLIRAMTNFIHQALVHIDPYIYALEHIEEGLCRHPELTAKLSQTFRARFSPEEHNEDAYLKMRESLLVDIEKLDTGHEDNDIRRKNILRQGVNFIHHILKTNFYRLNKTSISFRLDPEYLKYLPFDRSKKFPELPYGIFYIKGMHFFGFHIRFKDLARGGMRTVIPEHTEREILERNNVFTECYNLALTQDMKNKDIPEGGAKALLFLKPYEHLESEAAVHRRELLASDLEEDEIERRLDIFRHEQRTTHLYQAQRSFIESLVTLVNCDPDGQLRARDIVDYWQKPEYLYIGPDENMHDSMIQWIAQYSHKHHYKPGTSFISGKPLRGINHKEYGVTSLGLNVYVEAILKYLEIDPYRDTFTVKMSGGPDGDVAGNEIKNLYRYYPKTALLIALTDATGTIYDPRGLDLAALVTLFHEGRGIRYYPPQKLHMDGFMVDKLTKRYQTPLVQQTLCWRMGPGKLEQEWLSGSDTNHLLRHNVHQVPADLFIPAGGRPRTLNESNYEDFLDDTGKPTARAIVEGANLYLSPGARRSLEELGVLIIKDSSANKTGVICSSFEVLCGLTLGDEKFVEYKPVLVEEILERLKQCALNEATLLLSNHTKTGDFLTDISDRISKRINLFGDQLLEYLENVDLSDDPKDPLVKCFLSYCLSTLKNKFQAELLREIPASHKKAIIASYIASHLVYKRGLLWFPSIVDILPTLEREFTDSSTQ